MLMTQTIYKIIPVTFWHTAEQAGVFKGVGIDLADGFIHLSTAAQVRRTAALYFKGVNGLVLVAIDAGRLGDALVYEASRDGALFPHLYGPLPLTAVLDVAPMPIGADGFHIFGGAIP